MPELHGSYNFKKANFGLFVVCDSVKLLEYGGLYWLQLLLNYKPKENMDKKKTHLYVLVNVHSDA